MAATQTVRRGSEAPGSSGRKGPFGDAADDHAGPFGRVALPPAGERQAERNVELCECMIDVAAALFNVSSKELRRPGRSSTAVSRVRQVAMYVAHVVLGLSMNEVGRGFGRDRTTVLHACHLIEDMRDDEDFDRIVAVTERVADAALRRRGAA